jgi:hypothetical protein
MTWLLFKFNCYYEIKGNAIQRWNFYKGDYTEMAKKMDSDWKTTLSDKDPDTSFELFHKAFERAKEKCIPKCSSKAGTKAKQHNYLPLDERIIQETKHKHRWWTRYMENRDPKKYKEFVRSRNKVKTMVEKAKIQMEKEIAENAKVNPKKFWQYANSKRKTKSGIGELKTTNSNGEVDTAKTDKEKAEVLANFYSSVFTRKPDGDIPQLEACQIQYPFT